MSEAHVQAVSASVVIATKGRPDDLSDALGSIVACDPGPLEVIVVDGDPERSAEPVVASFADEADAPPFRYIASDPSSTRQRNLGIDVASADTVVFLDDDVEVDPGLFAALASAYEDPAVVGATGLVIEPSKRSFGNKRSLVRRLLVPGREGTMTSFGYPRRLQDEHAVRDVEFMQGCLMGSRTEAARRIRFDERLGGYALAEDEDFSYRLSRLGRLRYLPSAVVVHKNSGLGTLGTRNFNRVVAVNRMYLFRKNFPQTLAARVQFGGLLLLLLGHRLVNREWDGARGLIEGAVEGLRGDPR